MIDPLILSTSTRVDSIVKDIADLKASLEFSQRDITSHAWADLNSKSQIIDAINKDVESLLKGFLIQVPRKAGMSIPWESKQAK